jgi:hypothetical protein
VYEIEPDPDCGRANVSLDGEPTGRHHGLLLALSILKPLLSILHHLQDGMRRCVIDRSDRHHEKESSVG